MRHRPSLRELLDHSRVKTLSNCQLSSSERSLPLFFVLFSLVFFLTPALSPLFPYLTPPPSLLYLPKPPTIIHPFNPLLWHAASSHSLKMMLKTNPPLLHHYEQVSRQLVPPPPPPSLQHHHDHPPPALVMEECQLPLIDLSDLSSCDEKVRADCAAAICRASSEWGFFQVVNHGIHPELVSKMKEEQAKLFQLPFDKKVNSGLLNNSYRWGTPTATCPKQLSWSEAFHVPLSKISQEDCYGEFTSLRKVMVEFAEAMSKLAGVLAGVLAENLGHSSGNFADICQESSCFLRLNRYPACPMSPEIFRLVPHTDSDFLTILSQDQVGGLQLMKDSRWVAVKPNQDALIVNIGDLFQAWSNDIYKSVEHKVMANAKTERYSTAYFLCPSYETSIESYREPSNYRKFTFGEYRSQIQEDVKKHGHKIGLPSFRTGP